MPSAATRQDTKSPGRRVTDASPQRRCLVSRESYPTDQLVRFVVGPDNSVVPDIEGRLPGRGLWLRATRDIVDDACRKRIFAKAARSPVVVVDGLADRIEDLLRRRCLNLLGLARRAGDAVGGFEKVSAALAGGKAGVFLIACDAGEEGRRKLLSIAGDVPVVELFTSEELGGVFGRERIVYIAVEFGGLSTRLVSEACRLSGFRRSQTA